ncbi:YbhB/YbcL family Raf kinase inhibitor-like protein [Candidatus Dependentiae bacterium]
MIIRYGWYLAGALLAVVVLFLGRMFAKKKNVTGSTAKASTKSVERKVVKINVSSSAFSDGDTLPINYTCEGKDISPPISWSNLPPNTKSVALVCDDPDAPMGTWVHWVLFNIPVNVTSLEEGVDETTISGVVRGNNSWNRVGYGGACPPSGKHRYIFRVYAFDTTLSIKEGSTKIELADAMKGHVLGEGELMSKYARRSSKSE